MAATTLQSPVFPRRNASPYIQLGETVQDSAFQRIGFLFLLVFLFLAFSRVFDVKFSNFHITGIAYRIAFAMTILSRAFLTAIKTKIGRAMLGFTICFGM